MSRFQREAEVLASLNHPNIAAIYDLQEAGGTRFLVLELVEGAALEAAHEQSVAHRDLKPANVKITPDGKVKVLDFGLAKAFSGEAPDVNLSNSPTLSMAATNAGVILGTAAYMSPEQARAESTDRRADIFFFGCVLYELLTGRQVFQGKTVSDILASVLARELDFNLLPAKLNPRIQQLLRRTLEKEPKRRWQAAGDLRMEIEAVLVDSRGEGIPGTHPEFPLEFGVRPWNSLVAPSRYFSML